MRPRRVAIGLIALGVIVGIGATGGISAGTVDRGTHVAVVDHGDGLFGVTPLDPDGLTPPNEEMVGLFEVTNHVGTDVKVSATPVGEPHRGSPPKLKSWDEHSAKSWDEHSDAPATLGQQESGTIYGTPVCDGVNATDSTTVRFQFTVEATDAAIRATITDVPVTITCEGDPGNSGDAPKSDRESSADRS